MKKKILTLAAVVTLPFILLVMYLLASMASYSNTYSEIVSNMTVANNYNLNFKEGATVNDVVVLRGKITYVGRTSMEVRVDTYVESRHGIRKVINRAYVVMVAVDEHHHPIPVPGLIVESENDRAEWEGGEKRYQLRKQRRREGF